MPGCDACAVRTNTRADCAERPGSPRETGTSTVPGAISSPAAGTQARLALPPPTLQYLRPEGLMLDAPSLPHASLDAVHCQGKLPFETGQQMRRSVAWGPPCRSRRPWCPRHRTAPQALVHRKRPEGCELPRGRLPSLRFESICKFTSAFELSSAAVGHLTGFLTQLRAVRDAALTRFCLLPAPWGEWRARAVLQDPSPPTPAATVLHCSAGR